MRTVSHNLLRGLKTADTAMIFDRDYNCSIKSFTRLTHLFLMHPFSISWKHQKILEFSDVFRGQRKGALGANRLNRERSSSSTHKFTFTSPLLAKNESLNSCHNKLQLINLICEELVSIAAIMNESRSLFATDSASSTIKVKVIVLL